VIDYTKEPWEIAPRPNLDAMDDLAVVALADQGPIPIHPTVFARLADGRQLAIASIYRVEGLSGTTDGNAKLIRAAPEIAEFLLFGYQHISHGGPTRGDLEDLLRKIGLIS